MKKFLIPIFIVLPIYYLITFVFSFIIISQSVVDNNPMQLKSYINKSHLSYSISTSIKELEKNFSSNKSKKINIQNNNIIFSGELSPSFYKRLFSKLSKNLSEDFSSSEVMLYFYYNTDELKEYINNYLSNFGNYNFQKFIQTKNNNDEFNEAANDVEEQGPEKSDSEDKKDFTQGLISKLIEKYNYTDYFFLTTPIHFKLEVKHQDLPFFVIFKFNGFKWRINNINIPFNLLIDNQISFIEE